MENTRSYLCKEHEYWDQDFIAGATYNIPLSVLLQENHPEVPPLVYVRPTSTMAIKESEYVDKNGRVYHPYLHKWNQVWQIIELEIMWANLGISGRVSIDTYTLDRYSWSTFDQCSNDAMPLHPLTTIEWLLSSVGWVSIGLLIEYWLRCWLRVVTERNIHRVSLVHISFTTANVY